MSLDSSLDDDFDLPDVEPQSSKAKGGKAASDDDDGDEYADLFQKKKHHDPIFAAYPHSTHSKSQLSPTTSPSAQQRPPSHVCDECEEVFTDSVVYCTECEMTYCSSCDRTYHSSNDALGLREHERRTLTTKGGGGEKKCRPKIWEKEEKEEKEQQQRREMKEVGSSDPTLSITKTVAFTDYHGHASNAAVRASPPDAWNTSAASASDETFEVQYSPSFQQTSSASPHQQQNWFGGTSSITITSPHSSSTASKPLRPSSATTVSRSRPSSSSFQAQTQSQIPKTVMVLKSTRPIHRFSTTDLRASSSAKSFDPFGDAAAGVVKKKKKNPLPLHEQHARAQAAAKKAASVSSTTSHAATSSTDPSTLLTLNTQILSLKVQISTLVDLKSHMKTQIAKKSRSLKEVARIAKSLAKQPNLKNKLNEMDYLNLNGTQYAASQSHSSSQKSSSSSSSHHHHPELHTKFTRLQSSTEILHFECAELRTKLRVLRDAYENRTTEKKELKEMERERADLIKQVSIDVSGRELDRFKSEQIIGDLEFATREMKKTIEEKKGKTKEMQAQTQSLEMKNRGLKQEYEQLQARLDRAAVREVTEASRQYR